MDYFLLVNNQQTGPYTELQIRTGIQGRSIAPEVLAWREGLTDWTAVGSLPEMSHDSSGSNIPNEAATVQNRGGRTRGVFILSRIVGSLLALLGLLLIWGDLVVGAFYISLGAFVLGFEWRPLWRIPALICFVCSLVLWFFAFLAFAGFTQGNASALEFLRQSIGPAILLGVSIWLWDKARVRK